MSDPFDFTAFLKQASMVDDDTKRELLRSEVAEATDEVMGEVAPRIWCILLEQMAKDEKNNIHLNAVLNSAMFAIVSWVAVCTPKGTTNGQSNDDALRSKLMTNLEVALAQSREDGGQMANIARNAGKLKLMEDALSGLSNTLMTNSMIIKGIHSYIEKERK